MKQFLAGAITGMAVAAILLGRAAPVRVAYEVGKEAGRADAGTQTARRGERLSPQEPGPVGSSS